MACHAVDKKLVGPAYQEVAKKYKASDEAMLADKVRKGGKGVWGLSLIHISEPTRPY